jgi:hypothetical protein
MNKKVKKDPIDIEYFASLSLEELMGDLTVK